MNKPFTIFLSLLLIVGCSASSRVKDEEYFNRNCYSKYGETVENDGAPEWSFIPVYVPNPIYPRQAIDQKRGGYVVLEMDIVKDGRVENVEVIEACPKNLFNKAAKDAAEKIRYGVQPDGIKRTKIEGVLYRYIFMPVR